MTPEANTDAPPPAPAATPVARRVVDARGAWCPGPLMELIAAIREEEVGAEIELLSSDQGSRKDVPLWLEKARQQLVQIQEESGYDRFVIRKVR